MVQNDVDKIIKLVEESGVTAYEIAKNTNLTEAGILKILSGKTKRPHKSTVESILNYLSNPVESIGNVSVTEPLTFFKTKSGNNYEELPNGKYLITVPLVHVKAQATYVSEHTDAEFVQDLRQVSFYVDRVGNGRYMAFEVMNDSMNDGSIESIPDGAVVLGRDLGKQHWRDQLRIKQNPYWVIVHKDSVMVKKIISHNTDTGDIVCHSLNGSPEFSDFTINLNDVHQLFNIIKKQL